MHKRKNNYKALHNFKKITKKIFNPDGKNMIPEEQDALDYLALSGGIQVVGIDSETGEMLYSFTPKIKEIFPELYEQHLNYVNQELMRLWENGFVNIELMDDDPLVTLTEKAFDSDELSRLSKEDLWSIAELKRMLKA